MHTLLKARFALVVLILLMLALPESAQAGDIRVARSTAEQNGTKGITFTLTAYSPDTIDAVSLVYGVVGNNCLDQDIRRKFDVTPAAEVIITHKWNPGFDTFFIPGLEIWWRWEIHDQSGAARQTEIQRMVLVDPAFDWQVLEQERISLYWSQGDLSFGKRLIHIAAESLERIEREANFKAPQHIRMVIYPTQQDMLGGLAYMMDWAGGVALNGYDLIIIAIPPGGHYRWAEESIPHELAHLVTSSGFNTCQMTRLPLWLMEGLAQYAEGPVRSKERDLVYAALDEGQLPALKDLDNDYPKDTAQVTLAYAQSRVVVDYMITVYGMDSINQLVADLRGGKTIDQALRARYGFTTSQLDQAWRASEGYGEAPTPDFNTPTPFPTRTPLSTLALKPSVHQVEASPTPSPTSAAASPTGAASPTSSPTSVAATEIASRSITAIPIGAAASPAPQIPLAYWLFCPLGVLLGTLGFIAVLVWLMKKAKQG